ncbi:MAG: tyrosine-protein phosphatase, partial [Alphaproteobacteria bacterium]|nr:tyrosine-protein phosphatase [Alphaproteobacteria bacterium]
DDLVADYLLTNDETRIVRRIPFMMEFVAQHAGRAPTEEAVRTALSVHPEYLQAAFAVMREQCGSLDGYLEQALGVDRAMREAIAERILV